MHYNEEILIENIKKKGNKVLIWGACERNNDILEFFRENDVNVVGYIDKKAEEQIEHMSNIHTYIHTYIHTMTCRCTVKI